MFENPHEALAEGGVFEHKDGNLKKLNSFLLGFLIIFYYLY